LKTEEEWTSQYPCWFVSGFLTINITGLRNERNQSLDAHDDNTCLNKG
jgi:hypothetical protein